MMMVMSPKIIIAIIVIDPKCNCQILQSVPVLSKRGYL